MNKYFHKKSFLLIVIFLIILVLSIWLLFFKSQSYVLKGTYRGQEYKIEFEKTLITGFLLRKTIKAEVEKTILNTERMLSVYNPDSELNAFNNNKTLMFRVSEEFYYLLRAGHVLNLITNGSWDATARPLELLWENNKPMKEQVSRVLNDIGYDNIIILENNYIQKLNKDIQLDFSRIANGYLIEKIAHLLEKKKILSYLIRNGDELMTGEKANKRKWLISVGRWDNQSKAYQEFRQLKIINKAVTSRCKTADNYVNPLSGYPSANNLVSVTIIGASPILTSGLTTAVYILGKEEGLKMINKIPSVDAFIVYAKNGKLYHEFSTGFKKYAKI